LDGRITKLVASVPPNSTFAAFGFQEARLTGENGKKLDDIVSFNEIENILIKKMGEKKFKHKASKKLDALYMKKRYLFVCVCKEQNCRSNTGI